MPFVDKTYYITKPIAAFLFLMRECGYTQSQAQKILDKKRLTQNNRPIAKGEVISGEVVLSEFEASGVELEPLFYNEDFCVYDKPHNLLTHPKGRFHHYSLNDALKARFGKGANAIHRLDAQTSGLVLCAINPDSESRLKDMMASRLIYKSYHALVEGQPQAMVINQKIATHKQLYGSLRMDLGIKSVISQKGKDSQTRIVPLGYDAVRDISLIEAIPLTGRTHQIRLHLSSIGHRILGDPLYGVEEAHSRAYLERKLGKEEYKHYFGEEVLCLNAYKLSFRFKEREYCFKSALGFSL